MQSFGIGGGLAVLGYMMYGLKNRKPGEKLSVYLIHTRLGVQGTVVGALTLGMAMHMYHERVQPWLEERKHAKSKSSD